MAPKLYRASDVCASTELQPYVLRSWEKEFPGIGVQKSQDSPRLYRQSDVEQVLRIKELVFGEGLTLAGARRRLETSRPVDEHAAEAAEMAEVLDTLGADARARVGSVRSGLRSILELLSKNAGGADSVVTLDAASSEGERGQRSVRPERAKASPARPRAGRAKAASSKRTGGAETGVEAALKT